MADAFVRSESDQRTVDDKIARLRARLKNAKWYEGEPARLANVVLGILDLLGDEL
jgi:hypothetical protein